MIGGGLVIEKELATLDSFGIFTPDLQYFLLTVCTYSTGGYLSGRKCASPLSLYKSSWLLIYCAYF